MVDRMSYKRAAYEYDATDDASLDDSDERDEDNNQGQHDYHP